MNIRYRGDPRQPRDAEGEAEPRPQQHQQQHQHQHQQPQQPNYGELHQHQPQPQARLSSAHEPSQSRLSAYEPQQARVPSIYEPPPQTRVPSGGYHGGGGHGLRPMDSRFSLNEQFAATRREYEFGEDDVVSVFDRLTLSDIEWREPSIWAPSGEGLSTDDVRKAYWKWCGLLCPENHDPSARESAWKYFLRVQMAFETLLDPQQRAAYDFALRSGYDPGSEGFALLLADALERQAARAARVQTGSDLGIRVDASALVKRLRGEPVKGGTGLRPLDFTLGHHLTVAVPGLGNLVKSGLRTVQGQILAAPEPASEKGETPTITFDSASLDSAREAPVFIVPAPSLTVSGSVFGVAEDMAQMPMSLLSDRYQPLLPLAIPRQRLIRLVESRLLPLVTARLRQDVHRTTSDAQTILSSTSIELESDVLPRAALTVRAAHSAAFHGRPTTRIAGSGTAFARVDSGDWALATEDTCKFFSEFSRVSRRFFYAEFPVRVPASVELGYTTTPCARGPALDVSAHAPASVSSVAVAANHNGDVPAGEGGMRGLDDELDAVGSGSWAASLAATADSLGAYLRYGRDVANVATLLPWKRTSPGPGSTDPRPARFEAELCANTLLDRYLAVRHLFPVGRCSRLGLELGLSSHGLHLSLYWSRLRHRLSLPFFLLSPRSLPHPARRLLLCCAAAPFLLVGCLRLLAAATTAAARGKNPADDGNRRKKNRVMAAKRAARRAEADDLTFLLHRALHSRANAAPAASSDASSPLTIVSAKYGAADAGWAGEDVADVTVALAALAREPGGPIVIPARLRISRLPGFWDPAPGRDKVLRVSSVE
ncbi:unnamed protein product [Parascedosporium putredinis]|uniref:J domain-containing protein n=1 Tax=Parascedosporium putredinis TaxID=1442378 RepID=A0A9P1MFG5_9PEZI|nr:unnamed protein product [Parascedosporium putredinis]CAI8003416.1 unnamed protein product [Parascedosporium putredinis]